MKEIKLSKGYIAIVDDEDYEYLSQWKWYADVKPYTVYAARAIRKNGIKTSIRMHAIILGLNKGEICDHIDHNGLNNQKANIRKCNASENAKNRRSSINSKSKYLGVFPSFRKNNPWRAQIKVNGNKISLGNYKQEINAAMAYDVAAIKYYKEYANLNILADPSLRHSA